MKYMLFKRKKLNLKNQTIIIIILSICILLFGLHIHHIFVCDFPSAFKEFLLLLL